MVKAARVSKPQRMSKPAASLPWSSLILLAKDTCVKVSRVAFRSRLVVGVAEIEGKRYLDFTCSIGVTHLVFL